MEQDQMTFSMIKPDATQRGLIGYIIGRIETAGLRFMDIRYGALARADAEFLYAEHKDKDHFKDLIDYTVSGPVVLMALKGPDAIRQLRDLMGATWPSDRQPGTIRHAIGDSVVVRRNGIHGSDGPEAAARELDYFFYGRLR